MRKALSCGLLLALAAAQVASRLGFKD